MVTPVVFFLSIDILGYRLEMVVAYTECGIPGIPLKMVTGEYFADKVCRCPLNLVQEFGNCSGGRQLHQQVDMIGHSTDGNRCTLELVAL